MNKIKLKLYNTLKRKKEEFIPIKKEEVKMYSCGPTVYSYQHIGNLKTYIFTDILKRTLLFNKYKVKNIINITDVGHLTSDADEGEDKMEKAAAKEGKNAKDIAEHYFSVFHEELKELNFLEPTKWTKATDHIEEQIKLIKTLEKKGYTYITSDGVYFDSSKFKDYGKLARLNIKGIKAGKRVSIKEKKNPTDFALWKFSTKKEKRQQEWSSPWGTGFPGWHIECSAMSIKYLGEHFDIHTGGEDHINVHHTNEIAQSEAATNKKFVNYWLHSAYLTYNGEKISKSKGGLFTLSDLKDKGFSAMQFKYFILLTNYRKTLNFSLEHLDSAKTAFERLKRKILEIKSQKHIGKDLTKEYYEKFLKAINDDLNTPEAIAIIWNMLDNFDFDPKKKIKLLEVFDEILALGIKNLKQKEIKIPKEVKDLLEAREHFRKEKMFKEADIIRNRILERGYKIEDTLIGPTLEKI